MYSLVFLALISLAAAAPQGIIPYSLGMMPYTHISGIMPMQTGIMPMQTGIMPMQTGIMPMGAGIMGYMPRMIMPSMITSDMPKPVEDTPEVKQAKAAFAMEYQKALMGTRQKRDITGLHTIPITSTMNMMPYTPNILRSVFDPTHIYSTPIITHF